MQQGKTAKVIVSIVAKQTVIKRYVKEVQLQYIHTHKGKGKGKIFLVLN
jgi:hypothetical protein